MKQALLKDLRCTVSAGVAADLFLRQLRQGGMKIHPAPIGHAETLIELAALQRLFGVLVAAVAQEQGRNVGVHVIGAGVDAGHALLVGLLFTCLINFLGQMGHAEQIDVFKAIGLPELGLLGQHIFGGFCIKIHLCGQRLLMLLTAPYVEIILIDLTQALNGIFSRHLFHRPFSFTRELVFSADFRDFKREIFNRENVHFS